MTSYKDLRDSLSLPSIYSPDLSPVSVFYRLISFFASFAMIKAAIRSVAIFLSSQKYQYSDFHGYFDTSVRGLSIRCGWEFKLHIHETLLSFLTFSIALNVVG